MSARDRFHELVRTALEEEEKGLLAGSEGDSSDGDSTPTEREPLSRSGGIRPMFRSAPRQEAGVISPCSFSPCPLPLVEKQGWVITHDPYHIDLGFVDFYIDLGAELLLAATKDEEKIAVEIKTFLAPSTISEFHTAIGQFINYRIALEDDDPERRLYLAVPLDVYKRFFRYPFIQTVIVRNKIPLLVYDTEKQEIAEWIS